MIKESKKRYPLVGVELRRKVRRRAEISTCARKKRQLPKGVLSRRKMRWRYGTI